MPRGGTCYYPKMGWKQKAFWVVMVVALVVAYGILFTTDCEAADLKCVTIKFKNDSELKFKTQWFINACDTTKNIVWVRHQYMDSVTVSDDLAEKDRQGLKYQWVNQEYGIIRWQEIQLTIICHTLLWPPQIITPVVIACPEWNHNYGWSRGDSLFESFKCDTLPGEALLWYEEVKH